VGCVRRSGDVNVVDHPQVGVLSARVVGAKHNSDVAMAPGQSRKPAARQRVFNVGVGITAYGVVESVHLNEAAVGCRVRCKYVVASRSADSTLKTHL